MNTSSMAPDEQLQPTAALFSTDHRFAIHGVIMMLVLVFLFALFLFIILLRLYLRKSKKPIGNNSDRWSPSPVTPDIPESPPLPATTTSAAICSELPVYRYRPDRKQSRECVVCLSEFREKEVLRRIPACGHDFHKRCIDSWFQSHTSCPICRKPINNPARDVGFSSEVDQQRRLDLLLRSVQSTLREYENNGFGGQSSQRRQQLRDYRFEEMRRNLEDLVIL